MTTIQACRFKKINSIGTGGMPAKICRIKRGIHQPYYKIGLCVIRITTCVMKSMLWGKKRSLTIGCALGTNYIVSIYVPFG